MDGRIKTLRDGESLNLFDRSTKYFVKIQLNRKEKFVCWERWVSLDRRNWINHNMYLRLKDVMQILTEIKTKNATP